MTFPSEIQDVVKRFVGMGTMFTSVDVANEVKRSGTWRRNSEVAIEVRRMFRDEECGLESYENDTINVLGGSKRAVLYHLSGTDPDDYQDRDQHALTPSDVPQAVKAPAKKVQKATPAPAPQKAVVLKRAKRTMTTQVADASDIGSVIDTNIIMSSIVRSKERIKIAAPMIRKLGWLPGQQADLSRIKTHRALKVGVIVSKEGRVSIPRKAVKWGSQPVKVMLTDANEVIFSRATKKNA